MLPHAHKQSHTAKQCLTLKNKQHYFIDSIFTIMHLMYEYDLCTILHPYMPGEHLWYGLCSLLESTLLSV